MAFTTPEKMLAAMSEDLLPLIKESTHIHLKSCGFSDRFINELVMGALRTNYGQTTDIQAFVGK